MANDTCNTEYDNSEQEIVWMKTCFAGISNIHLGGVDINVACFSLVFWSELAHLCTDMEQTNEKSSFIFDTYPTQVHL